jgi:hypothetical protein
MQDKVQSKETEVSTFIGLFLVRWRCPERSNHRWVPRPTVPPLAWGAPRQLCCILTKPVIMPPPPVLTFSLTLPYLNAPRRARSMYNIQIGGNSTPHSAWKWDENTTAHYDCGPQGNENYLHASFLFRVCLPWCPTRCAVCSSWVCFNYYLCDERACVSRSI